MMIKVSKVICNCEWNVKRLQYLCKLFVVCRYFVISSQEDCRSGDDILIDPCLPH